MSIANNLEKVEQRIAAACARAGRSRDSVRLMAVTKTVEAERILEAARLGLRLFGENRVQERQAKQETLAGIAADWHLIGGLQSNKANRAAELFDVVESVDSLALAQRLDHAAERTGRVLPVLVQVNIGREPQKHGAPPEAAASLAAAIASLPHLRLQGLMAVPPAAADPEASRPWFAALRRLSEQIRPKVSESGQPWELSMGMSHDFEVAIEEGSTLVRVGSALFGERTRP